MKPEKMPPLPDDPGIPQRLASDPLASAWVTASAGAGKTKVLIDRALRLMLDGAAPDQVMCLTFTRAAAAVMTLRLRDELGVWAACSDRELKRRLEILTGRPPGNDDMRRARGLFAAVLDAQGALRVQTIHSFAEGLIRRFPIESGIPPYFDVMDDQTAADLLRESKAAVLRQAHAAPGSPLARAIHMVTPEVPEDDFESLLHGLTYRRGQLLAIFAQHGGLEGTVDAVYAWLKAPRGQDSKKMAERLNADTGLDEDAPDLAGLSRAAGILAGGAQTDREKAEVIRAWLLNPEMRAEIFWDYARVFLTAEGEQRKRLTTKAAEPARETLEDEAARLLRGIDAIATMNVARGTESILRLTAAILETYEQKKRARNLLDYDDLVHRANVLMRETNAGGWVLQKLPGDLRHILVDEAQDTNPDQWQLVAGIAHEFFTNPARVQAGGHTLFAVGDEKQSIFSFQRADPAEFERRRKYFESLVRQSGGTWREVEMQTAFRSSPAVTQAVDAVFANPAAADGLFPDNGGAGRTVRHRPFRAGQAGLVELHPVLRGAPAPETKPWSLPLETENVFHPAAALAENIAEKIKGWLDNGERLEARGRAMNPADILILVRRRSEFVDHMVRALKKRDIPVAGADRMSLSGQIAVMDLTALGGCLLFPKDDYRLACVLKSPLVGMTDRHLEDIAAGRAGDLWTALSEKAADPKAPKIYGRALSWLSALRGELNAERPYEFYAGVLTDPCPASASSGLSALYGRLGFEAEDPLVEFLNAVEKFEKTHVPSLQGFLSWLDAGEAEVKRELSLDPGSPRVHIMTVHGAKGLEAPVVILPDTTGLPADNAQARPRFLWPEEGRDVPLWSPRADLESRVFEAERKKAETSRDRECRRLLYVAMTRAADRLYVFGASGGRDTPEESWHGLIEKGLRAHLNVGPDAAGVLQHAVPQTAAPVPDGMKPLKNRKPVLIPAWARTQAGADQTPLARFKPSAWNAANNNTAAPSPLTEKDEGHYRLLGTAVHNLFECLPALPPAEREDAARKYLSKPAWSLDAPEQERALKNVMAVLEDPEFGALFGPNSRAEVSVAGMVAHAGRAEVMNAQIDRLVVDEKTVLIVDYKHARKVPKTPEDVSFDYVAQMAAYRLALQRIYPGREVKCALLYTRKSRLVPLPGEMLDAALKKLALTPAPPPQKKPAGPGQ